jgi:hypothetical protein
VFGEFFNFDNHMQRANQDVVSCDLCQVTFTGRYCHKSLRQHVRNTIQHAENVAAAATAARAMQDAEEMDRMDDRVEERYAHSPGGFGGDFADPGFVGGRSIEIDSEDEGNHLVIVDGDNTFDARSGPDLDNENNGSDDDEGNDEEGDDEIEEDDDDDDDNEEQAKNDDGIPAGVDPFDFQFLAAFRARMAAAGLHGPRPAEADLPQVDPTAPKPGAMCFFNE